MRIIQLTNSTPTQMMGYVIQADSGEVLVIDGGNPGDSEELKRVIKSVGGRVDLWLITHPHADHFSAFMNLYNDPEISFKLLGESHASDEWANKFNGGDAKEVLTWNEFVRNNRDERYFTIKKGQEFQLGSMKIEVLQESNPEILVSVNDQSSVFKVTEDDFTFLVLGDLGETAGKKLLSTGVDITCHGVQMAHHGQQGVNEEFYQVMKPEYCFWPTPDWLWYNMRDGVPSAGPFKTEETAKWMKKLNTVNVLNFEYTVVFDTKTKEVTKY